jgi:hypothetical protein
LIPSTSVISSQPLQSEEAGGSLRKFLPLDYYEMPKNRGKITNLEGYSGILIIQTEDSIYKTTSKVTLKNMDDADITIGSASIFEVEPTEILTVPAGYAGCQHPYAVHLSKAGMFFVDSKSKKVFLLREKLDEISNAGLRTFFEENLQFEIVKSCKLLSIKTGTLDLYNDSPFSPYGVGYTVAYDDRYGRIIFAKRDFKVKDGKWDDFNSLYKLVDGRIQDKDTSTDQVLANLTDYLEDNSFTISFSTIENFWASFHTYKPVFLFNTKSKFYGALSTAVGIFRYNIDYRNGRYYGLSLVQSWIDVAIPDKASQNAITSNVSWSSRFENSSGNPEVLKTFDRAIVYNSFQASAVSTLIPSGGSRNIRLVKGRWNFNSFRDDTGTDGSDPNNLPVQKNFELLVDGSGVPVNYDSGKPWYNRKRFIDTYACIRLGYSNTEDAVLYLYDLETTGRPAVR